MPRVQFPQHRQFQFHELVLSYRLHHQDDDIKKALKLLLHVQKMTSRQRVRAIILVVRSREQMQTRVSFAMHVYMCAFLALELDGHVQVSHFARFMSGLCREFVQLNPETTTQLYHELLHSLYGVYKFPDDPLELEDTKFDYHVKFNLFRVRSSDVNDTWLSDQKSLGEGSFGLVLGANCHLNRQQCIRLNQPLPCAVKILKPECKTNAVLNYAPFYTELTALQWLQSLDLQVHNVPLQGVPRYFFSTIGTIYMERALWSLREMIHNRGAAMEFEQRVRFCYELLHVMNAIHKRGLAHMDLKPSNICVSNNGRPLIVDWGTCKFGDVFKESPHNVTCTTLWYRAPEDFDRANNKVPNICPAKMDVFSLGCILVEMLSNHICFQHNRPETTYPEVSARLSRVVFRIREMATRSPEFARFQHVAEKMLYLSPASRPTLAEVLLEPCWKGVNLAHNTFRYVL